MSLQPAQRKPGPDTLADVLERVLDKGVVIAGDIVVNVLDIELLTLKLRLFVASAETAREMGMDWWTRDPFFTGETGTLDTERSRGEAESGGQLDALEAENEKLRRRLAALEQGSAPEATSESERSERGDTSTAGRSVQ